MKRKSVLIFAALIVFLILPPYFAIAESLAKDSSRTFRLPSSLMVIEDEAFEGTAVQQVVLPEGLLSIGESAFENAPFLTDVYIPGTTEYIADSAFSMTANLTIHGIEGSYAMEWAQRNEIPFVVDDIWNGYALKGKTPHPQETPISRFVTVIVLLIAFWFIRSCDYERRSRRPQDRPELNPIDYRFP